MNHYNTNANNFNTELHSEKHIWHVHKYAAKLLTWKYWEKQFLTKLSSLGELKFIWNILVILKGLHQLSVEKIIWLQWNDEKATWLLI